jgi:hypothetical protein
MSTSTPKNLGDLGSGNEIVRARSVLLQTPYGGPDKIRVLQDKFVEVGGNVVHNDKAPVIDRDFDTVKAESYTFDGVTATVEQIRGLIAQAVDAWRAEDAT